MASTLAADAAVGQLQMRGNSGSAVRFPIVNFGYVGDGKSHPLSSVTRWQGRDTAGWTLTQWRTVFARADSLIDEIDRHAIQLFCDLNPERIFLELPPGTGVIDRSIVTGGAQHIHLRGAGRDITELWFFQAGGTLWGHGLTIPAAGTWTVEDITIRPKAICAAAFHVRFSGTQPAWCHIMRNVQFVPADGENYFASACITHNIKRGLDWQNIVAYGRHFHILSTNAFEFPSNIDQTTAGNSYNFSNVMTVGYAYAINFDFSGFISSQHHMHEEAQLYNVQAYAGVGLLRARNGNYSFAPADNFTLTACGWQGSGPALDLQYLEHVRMRDSLLVNDAIHGPVTCFASLKDCDSVLFDGNEIFSPQGSGLTGIAIDGPRSRNIVLNHNDVVAYSQFATFLSVASDVGVEAVEERGTRFTGSAQFASGKIDDRSHSAVSETRVAEASAKSSSTPPLPGSTSVSVGSDGSVTWDAIVPARFRKKDVSVHVEFPPGLFRQVTSATASGTDSWIGSWPVVDAISPDRMVVRYPQAVLSDGTVIHTQVRVIGR